MTTKTAMLLHPPTGNEKEENASRHAKKAWNSWQAWKIDQGKTGTRIWKQRIEREQTRKQGTRRALAQRQTGNAAGRG
jgi:hypothetical protein